MMRYLWTVAALSSWCSLFLKLFYIVSFCVLRIWFLMPFPFISLALAIYYFHRNKYVYVIFCFDEYLLTYFKVCFFRFDIFGMWLPSLVASEPKSAIYLQRIPPYVTDKLNKVCSVCSCYKSNEFEKHISSNIFNRKTRNTNVLAKCFINSSLELFEDEAIRRIGRFARSHWRTSILPNKYFKIRKRVIVSNICDWRNRCDVFHVWAIIIIQTDIFGSMDVIVSSY